MNTYPFVLSDRALDVCISTLQQATRHCPTNEAAAMLVEIASEYAEVERQRAYVDANFADEPYDEDGFDVNGDYVWNIDHERDEKMRMRYDL